MAMVFNAVRKDRFQFEGGARANCSRTELNQGVADTAEGVKPAHVCQQNV